MFIWVDKFLDIGNFFRLKLTYYLNEIISSPPEKKNTIFLTKESLPAQLSRF